MSARSTHRYYLWSLILASFFLTSCGALLSRTTDNDMTQGMPISVVKTEVVEIPATCPPVEPAPPVPPPVCKPKIVYQPVRIDDKLVIGEIEMVSVTGLKEEPVPARIDSGAETSSLNAISHTIFERDGERWVSFVVPMENGEEVTLERPLVRTVLIKQKNNKESIRRPVVMMKVRIADIDRIIEMTLADRAGFEYPVLIGRNFLKDMAIVDVSHAYLTSAKEVANTAE